MSRADRRRLRAAARRGAARSSPREMGFAAEEGLDLVLHREPSWAALRDRLIWGGYTAAHMLAPVVVAADRGHRPPATPRSTR